MSSKRLFYVLWAAVALRVALSAQNAPAGSLQPTAARCRVSGRITSGGVALPGVSLVARSGDSVRAATSTDVDGKYMIVFSPDASYHLTAELAGFAPADRDLTLPAAPCDQTLDLQLALRPRTPVSAQAAPSLGRRGNGENAAQGRGALPGQPGQRFQTLSVQADANGAATLDVAPGQEAEDLARLLPAGFSAQAAQADAIAITGNADATNLDRSVLNDRLQAIAQGQFDPATGQFAQGFGAQDGGFPGGAGFGGQGGGRGGAGGRGGGPGGRGGFVLGGRGARAQNPYQGSITYTFSGSGLNAPPYQLRPEVPVTQPLYAQNTFGGTFGGPFKIPGVYANANRRTNFQLNYNGNESNNVFDQYATVPTDAMRAGDFAGIATALTDPSTGAPFAGNQIPASRIDPSAAALLQYIPTPNLPGATQNYHVSTTAHNSSEALSLRVIQNLSSTVPPPGRGGAGAGGGRGGFGGGGFGGGRGGGRFGGPNGRGTSVVLTGQLQYRRNETQALNVFPDLGGTTTNTSISAPIQLNVQRGRSIQNLNVNFTHATVDTGNAFANTNNAAVSAGIQYPTAAATDPLNWGVPNLSFSGSGLTGVRLASATARTDNRFTAGYNWIHPTSKHQLRFGGDYRQDGSTNTINANPRGTFTFTGLYTGGSLATRPLGADFADFLLGLPQQATLQVGGTSQLRQRAFDVFVEDNWQKNAKLTFNLGLRYEFARPYVEVDGRMANLDVTPGFTLAVPVEPGAVGPFTGAFPSALLNTDANNVGPRLGVAYRLKPNTILRGGYSITYNSGSYASIARELTGQPPFADTETVNGGIIEPLTLAEALLSSSAATTNNWGVDKDYALGMIQTWNASLQRNLTQDWMLQAGYTGTKGSDLDILRAPHLGLPTVPVSSVQPFIWESSDGRSLMHGATFQIRRRLAHGYSGAFSYTLAKSMDDASSLGAGGAVVAQNDKDLGAEWARSSFDRRHQFSGNVYVELPWGPTRHWLKDGGTLASLVGEWSAQFTLTLQSGTPLTARVLGAATDLLRGVNGSLRADYNGTPVQLSNPTVDEFFNTTAFTAPPPGAFGDSMRNIIVGPGMHQLNGQFQRDIRLGGNRALTLQVNANNLLNTVQWASVDTNVNSSTFGQVLSARPMRTFTINMRFRY